MLISTKPFIFVLFLVGVTVRSAESLSSAIPLGTSTKSLSQESSAPRVPANLGVILDSNLSFENHISNVTKTAFFHLRNISKLWNMLSVSDAEKLVHAFMTSRLDYCNALLGGCPASSINKLQIVQNAAARDLWVIPYVYSSTVRFPSW